MSITHTKVSAIADGADTTVVRPSDWNADHTIAADTITAVMMAASSVDLATDTVTGILPTANGGTGIAYFTAAGPTVARVYTFPDAAATIARTDAAQTFTGNQTMSDSVGIGAAPGGHLDIAKTTPSLRFTNTGSGSKIWRLDGQTNNWSIVESGISAAMIFTPKLAGASSAHIAFGAATAPTGGGGPVLVMENQGGGPTSIAANTAGIFVNDVAGTTELFGFDEAGNTPQLTPHPAHLLNNLPVKATGPYAYPWAYSATNRFLGKSVKVDMAGGGGAGEAAAGKKITVIEANS